MDKQQIVTDIREGKLDVNNQELFFSIIIKGLILKLNEDITIRNIPIPHIILHTGDDTMYLMNKGQDQSKEPLEVSNENYVYNIVPRCIVTPGSIDLIPDQLTNPYCLGELQYNTDENLYSLSAEFRRMPLKLNCDIKYYIDSYTDMLSLIQQVITKLSFIRTYKVNYMGQQIVCSYKIPESFSEEHTMDIDGTMTDSKNKTLSLSLEIETNMPIYDPRTIMLNDKRIVYTENNINNI